MNRLSTIIATLAALSVIAAVSCTDAKVPTTGNEISKSFATLAQLFSAEQPDLQAQASTADDFADSFGRDPEALAFAKNKAKSDKDFERAAAASVLARFDNPEAVEELCDMIDDKSKLTRENVYVALQKQNTKEAREGLVRAVKIHGPENGLAEVICEVMDAEMWAATSEFIVVGLDGADEIEFDFDPAAIKELVARAKEHQFSTVEFDSEEFSVKMEAWGLKMAEKFGHSDKDVRIKIEVDKDDEEDTDDPVIR